MLSMTGYGRATADRDGRQLTVELKSVNHRFLDLAFRIPRNLAFLEEDARRELRETFTAAYRYGCPAEVLLRDVVTLSWNPYNAIRWTELAREEIENVCK